MKSKYVILTYKGIERNILRLEGVKEEIVEELRLCVLQGLIDSYGLYSEETYSKFISAAKFGAVEEV